MKTYTLEEVGNMYNFTSERVRQIESKAMRKICNSRRIHELETYFW